MVKVTCKNTNLIIFYFFRLKKNPEKKVRFKPQNFHHVIFIVQRAYGESDLKKYGHFFFVEKVTAGFEPGSSG